MPNTLNTNNSIRKPIIGVPASITEMAISGLLANTSGKRSIDSIVEFSNCIPIIIPALGENYNFKHLLNNFDGILLTGGRANVEPHHYNGKPFPEDEIIDPDRDNTVLPIIREAIERSMPIFGICRGIQEMNVAMGGTLHYRVNELPGKNDHRMPRGENIDVEEIFKLRHLIKLTPEGSFRKLIKNSELMVNSLHGQSVDKLASCFELEAITAEDNVVEGIRLKKDSSFTVGVQWHAEWEPQKDEHLLARKLYEEFGKACYKYLDAKL